MISAVQPSPRILKYLFGQHILNGLTVALGVGVVAGTVSLLFGFTAGMAAGTGAVCVSLGDLPSPLASKATLLPLALALAIAASLGIALGTGSPWSQGIVVLATSLLAGLLVGYGRWALPHSVLTMFAVVLALVTRSGSVAEALRHEGQFAVGGTAYVLVALFFSWLLDASSRRLAISECIREFAAYLRTVADFYAPTQKLAPDLAKVYGRVVEQQASLVDHLQSARNLIFTGRQTPAARRLAESLALLLEALDVLISLHADHAPLRHAAATVETGLPEQIKAFARAVAGDLDALALDLLARRGHIGLPDHRSDLAAIAAEVQRVTDLAVLPPREARALRATRLKLNWFTDYIGMLPVVLSRNKQLTSTVLDGVDLGAFVQPSSISPVLLRRHLTPSSTVFRHAVRLALAMETAYLLTVLVPAFDHGNWILLTVAVVLRASHSATRQRRDERMIGNVIGCLATAALLHLAPQPVLMFTLLLAVGVAHAFARVQYLVTATAACVMALLTLHFLNPVASPPVLARLLDTLIGVAIASVFSLVLARWEYQDAPKLVRSLKHTLALYVENALRFDNSVQSYRLARKSFVESLAAITESARRMAREPARVRAVLPDLERILAAAYVTGADIVAVRLITERRRAELDPALAAVCLAETRDAVTALLEPQAEPIVQPVPAEVTDEATLDITQALTLRCAELRLAAARLRDLVDDLERREESH